MITDMEMVMDVVNVILMVYDTFYMVYGKQIAIIITSTSYIHTIPMQAAMRSHRVSLKNSAAWLGQVILASLRGMDSPSSSPPSLPWGE